jgi:hypothetical protein
VGALGYFLNVLSLGEVRHGIESVIPGKGRGLKVDLGLRFGELGRALSHGGKERRRIKVAECCSATRQTKVVQVRRRRRASVIMHPPTKPPKVSRSVEGSGIAAKLDAEIVGSTPG